MSRRASQLDSRRGTAFLSFSSMRSSPLPPGPLSSSSSATPFLRSPDQSVAKRGLQTSRVPVNSPAQSQFGVGERKRALPKHRPRGTWNRNVIIIAGLRIRMFFRSSNLLTYYTTRIDGSEQWVGLRSDSHIMQMPALSLLRRPSRVPLCLLACFPQ